MSFKNPKDDASQAPHLAIAYQRQCLLLFRETMQVKIEKLLANPTKCELENMLDLRATFLDLDKKLESNLLAAIRGESVYLNEMRADLFQKLRDRKLLHLDNLEDVSEDHDIET